MFTMNLVQRHSLRSPAEPSRRLNIPPRMGRQIEVRRRVKPSSCRRLKYKCTFYLISFVAIFFLLTTCFFSLIDVIVWNCNGVGSRSFLRTATARDMLNTHKPSILGLLETRCSGEHANSICTWLGFDCWLRVEVVGFSGRI